MRHHTRQSFCFWHSAMAKRSSVLPGFAVVILEKLLHSWSVKREPYFFWQPGKLAQGKSNGGSSERGRKMTSSFKEKRTQAFMELRIFTAQDEICAYLLKCGESTYGNIYATICCHGFGKQNKTLHLQCLQCIVDSVGALKGFLSMKIITTQDVLLCLTI